MNNTNMNTTNDINNTIMNNTHMNNTIMNNTIMNNTHINIINIIDYNIYNYASILMLIFCIIIFIYTGCLNRLVYLEIINKRSAQHSVQYKETEL